jgi:hypothetical protein
MTITGDANATTYKLNTMLHSNILDMPSLRGCIIYNPTTNIYATITSSSASFIFTDTITVNKTLSSTALSKAPVKLYVGFANQLAAHSEGRYTTANGYGAHAEGQFTIALGSGTHAEGYEAMAFGDYSHVEGEATIASGVR